MLDKKYIAQQSWKKETQSKKSKPASTKSGKESQTQVDAIHQRLKEERCQMQI